MRNKGAIYNGMLFDILLYKINRLLNVKNLSDLFVFSFLWSILDYLFNKLRKGRVVTFYTSRAPLGSLRVTGLSNAYEYAFNDCGLPKF